MIARNYVSQETLAVDMLTAVKSCVSQSQVCVENAANIWRPDFRGHFVMPFAVGNNHSNLHTDQAVLI